MEEGEEEEEEEQGDKEEVQEGERTQEELTNMDNSQPSFRSRHSSQWKRPTISPRWAYMPRDRPYGNCRSLSSSMENMTFSVAPVSSSLNQLMNNEGMSGRRGFSDDASLQCSRNQGILVLCLMKTGERLTTNCCVHYVHFCVLGFCVVMQPNAQIIITDYVFLCWCRVVQVL